MKLRHFIYSVAALLHSLDDTHAAPLALTLVLNRRRDNVVIVMRKLLAPSS